MRLERYEYGQNGTFGKLFLGNGTVLHTLERTWMDNAPFVSCIPEGTYHLVPHDGTKYQDTWAIVGGTVGHWETDGKPRWTCVFHAGNWVSDTTGCVLVGVGRDNDMLTGSQEAMGYLREALRVLDALPILPIVNTSGSVGTGPVLDLEEPEPLLAPVEVPPAPVEATTMKSFLKSKTVWFNVVAGGLGAFLSTLQTSSIVDTETVAIALAIGNVVLRFMSREPIGLKGGK